MEQRIVLPVLDATGYGKSKSEVKEQMTHVGVVFFTRLVTHSRHVLLEEATLSPNLCFVLYTVFIPDMKRDL